ncbi:hypothetical protein JW756_00955 [Candidatus Woesearchaeota archaeon]|nr:hypothetical protein [Candidatus Woesearchaeota archaeon]
MLLKKVALAVRSAQIFAKNLVKSMRLLVLRTGVPLNRATEQIKFASVAPLSNEAELYRFTPASLALGHGGDFFIKKFFIEKKKQNLYILKE